MAVLITVTGRSAQAWRARSPASSPRASPRSMATSRGRPDRNRSIFSSNGTSITSKSSGSAPGATPDRDPTREAGGQPGDLLGDQRHRSERQEHRARRAPPGAHRLEQPARHLQRVGRVPGEAPVVLARHHAVEAHVGGQRGLGRGAPRRCPWRRARCAGRAASTRRPGAPRRRVAAAPPLPSGDMQIGVVFPQTEIASDPRAVRAYATGVEAIGLRAPARLRPRARRRSGGARRGGTAPTTSTPPSTSRSCCSATSPRSPTLELVTGIIILPQRQTALVAKQAAEVDLLTERPVPPRDRHRLEPGRVRGARQGLLHPRRPERSPGRAHAPALDRADRRPRGRRRADRRRRPRAAARATSHPDLVRCRVPAGLPPSRPPRRRLVPPGPPGPAPRRGPRHRGGRRRRGRARPRADRHGGPGRAGAQAASSSSSTTSAAGGTRERPTSASTRWGPASATSTATSACWPRWRPRSTSGRADGRRASFPIA